MSFKSSDDGSFTVVCDECDDVFLNNDGAAATFSDWESATDAIYKAGWEDYEIRLEPGIPYSPAWEKREPRPGVRVEHRCDDCIETEREDRFKPRRRRWRR